MHSLIFQCLEESYSQFQFEIHEVPDQLNQVFHQLPNISRNVSHLLVYNEVGRSVGRSVIRFVCYCVMVGDFKKKNNDK